jgi:maltooligosyltrehalose trehalohydrolase
MLRESLELIDLIPCGAQLSRDGHCQWRTWAPYAETVKLVLFDEAGTRSVQRMESENGGYYSCELSGIPEGQRYAFLINGEKERPDPASQWQPEGVHAASSVWMPTCFEWSDCDWEGVTRSELVIYELHVGTFTAEGTFAAIHSRLSELRQLGVTAIELMPVAQFPGRWNWGYDGVFWNAVQNSYGGPRELQRLVDACHKSGLAVILDVVYNHFGPEGCYLNDYGPYVTERYKTPWGPAINYYESGCQEVRAFVRNNVRQWIRDFHVDGLRLDAIHSIYDRGPRHILAEIKAAAEDESRSLRHPVHLIAESNLNDATILHHEDQGGYGLDAQWNDDFHHSIHTLMTKELHGYYQDFAGPQTHLEKVLNHVFAYDGNYSHFRGHRHGVPVEDRSSDQFVVSIQNHDQIGNRACGERLGHLAEPAQLRLAASLMLLSPYIPLLFMGEEYGEASPFPFFCDFSDSGMRDGVRRGRRREFPELAWAGKLPDPLDETTFRSAKLNWPKTGTETEPGLRKLYRDLLDVRQNWAALRDCQQRNAKLMTSLDGHPVLQLVRGDPQAPALQVIVFFNLNHFEITLPDSSCRALRVIVRTEDTKYSGGIGTGPFCGRLKPFECIVCQHRPEERL